MIKMKGDKMADNISNYKFCNFVSNLAKTKAKARNSEIRSRKKRTGKTSVSYIYNRNVLAKC